MNRHGRDKGTNRGIPSVGPYGDRTRYGGSIYDESSYLPRTPSEKGEPEGTGWLPTLVGTLLVLSGTYLLSKGFKATPRGAPQGRSDRDGGLDVRASVTIDRPASELYRYWRSLEKLPTIMRHLKSVEASGGNRSRWVAKGPWNTDITWEAETVEDRENERVAWRSVAGATVPNEGSVEFREAPGERGTEVHVSLTYHPPLGPVSAGVAKLFGEAPSQQVREDLRRFKQHLETGEVATTRGQPTGRT